MRFCITFTIIFSVPLSTRSGLVRIPVRRLKKGKGKVSVLPDVLEPCPGILFLPRVTTSPVAELAQCLSE